jgi:hypothetical protein
LNSFAIQPLFNFKKACFDEQNKPFSFWAVFEGEKAYFRRPLSKIEMMSANPKRIG